MTCSSLGVRGEGWSCDWDTELWLREIKISVLISVAQFLGDLDKSQLLFQFLVLIWGRLWFLVPLSNCVSVQLLVPWISLNSTFVCHPAQLALNSGWAFRCYYDIPKQEQEWSLWSGACVWAMHWSWQLLAGPLLLVYFDSAKAGTVSWAWTPCSELQITTTASNGWAPGAKHSLSDAAL